MKRIKLTQRKYASVDDCDFEWLSQWKWLYHNGYAERNSPIVNGRRGVIRMHRLIAETPFGMETDHINRNRLDNQRHNLRICTLGENQCNRGKYSNNTSGYKGVFWHKASCRWRAQIKTDGKIIHLGLFDDVKDAAYAYDRAAKEYHGEFARPNFKGE